MLKRKANIYSSNIYDEADENCISTSPEIHQRKIFRAKRPSRSLSQHSSNKFQMKNQLVSLEEELRLLSINNKPKNVINSSSNRKKPENSYEFNRFSIFSSLEPLKEIISTINSANESQRLKGFLESNLDKNETIIKFSAECKAVFNQNVINNENIANVLCKIITNGDKSMSFLVIQRDKSNEILINKLINRDTLCKELVNNSSSILFITFSKEKDFEDSIKLEMNSISKHLFLRCLYQCKLQS